MSQNGNQAALPEGHGFGSELRRPLGIAMVGGLLLSQVFTLYTTPVIYIFFDNLAKRMGGQKYAKKNSSKLPSQPEQKGDAQPEPEANP